MDGKDIKMREIKLRKSETSNKLGVLFVGN